MTASRHVARLCLALALAGSSACLSTHDESLGELAPTAPPPPPHDADTTPALDAGAPSEDAQLSETLAPSPLMPELDAAVVEHDAGHDAAGDAARDAALDASYDAGDAARDAARADACREPREPWECR